MTQIPQNDICKSHDEQRHAPFVFLSGLLYQTQIGWTIIEKEFFVIMATVNIMHWFIADCQGFDLCTYHNNRIYIFDLTFIINNISQTSLPKVLCNTVRLSAYNYTCIHIHGTNSIWAELLGR